MTNGLFIATVDFGPEVFTGGSNLLQLAVSTNQANAFNTLSPRQLVPPVPSTLYTLNAATAGSATTMAATGISSQIPVNKLSLPKPNNI